MRTFEEKEKYLQCRILSNIFSLLLFVSKVTLEKGTKIISVGSCWKLINHTQSSVDCLIITKDGKETIIENIQAGEARLLPLRCSTFKEIKFRPYKIDNIGFEWSEMPRKGPNIYCKHHQLPNNYWVFAFEDVNEKMTTTSSSSPILGSQKTTQFQLKSAVPYMINELILYCPLKLENLLAFEMIYHVHMNKLRSFFK